MWPFCNPTSFVCRSVWTHARHARGNYATTWRHTLIHGDVDYVMSPTDKRQIASGSGSLRHGWEAVSWNYDRSRSHRRRRAVEVLLDGGAQSATVQSCPRSSTWSYLSILHNWPAHRHHAGKSDIDVLPVYTDVILLLIFMHLRVRLSRVSCNATDTHATWYTIVHSDVCQLIICHRKYDIQSLTKNDIYLLYLSQLTLELELDYFKFIKPSGINFVLNWRWWSVIFKT